MKKISFTNQVGKELARFLKQSSYSQLAVLVDEHTFKNCYPLIKKKLPVHHVIKIKSGEKNKNLSTCTQVWKKLTELEFDRHALLINLGGGVIGDLGGFCAATFKRGISFIHIPTTLLAQVDASVGGKLGIDFLDYKNHIGLFREPINTIVDPVFLNTLSVRELKSGFAEVVKHCLIADKNRWKKLSHLSFTQINWEEWIKHSIRIKKHIVMLDPHEKNKRKLLNFGHTVGHALEGFFLRKGKKIRHGEAIAAGMIIESYLSFKYNGLSQYEYDQITLYIRSIWKLITYDDRDINSLINWMSQDKKNKNGVLQLTLLNGIGKAVTNVEITEEQMKAALRYYQQIY